LGAILFKQAPPIDFDLLEKLKRTLSSSEYKKVEEGLMKSSSFQDSKKLFSHIIGLALDSDRLTGEQKALLRLFDSKWLS